MTSPKRIRWQCPAGKHPGELGLRQPRKDATVRYCLPCSVETGRLVRRVAPALERTRAAGTERSKVRQARKRATAATARDRRRVALKERYTFEGHDLNEELTRLCRLRVFGGSTGRLARRRPRFDVAIFKRAPRTTFGVAWPDEWRFKLNRYPGQDWADVRETMVHELVHLHVGSGCERPHDESFRSLMRRAFMEAYGPNVAAPPNRYHGHYARVLRQRETMEVAS